MKLVVLGTGYVGSVVAAGFASHGHHVTAVDNQRHKVEMMKYMAIAHPTMKAELRIK